MKNLTGKSLRPTAVLGKSSKCSNGSLSQNLRRRGGQLVPFYLNIWKHPVKAKAPGAMGHVLPTSVTFSKSETATLGLALLVVVGALLLGVVVVASLYCLLVRYLWSSKRKKNDISFFQSFYFLSLQAESQK